MIFGRFIKCWIGLNELVAEVLALFSEVAGEVVPFQVLPKSLDRVEVGAVRWQIHRLDVMPTQALGFMPAGVVEHEQNANLPGPQDRICRGIRNGSKSISRMEKQKFESDQLAVHQRKREDQTQVPLSNNLNFARHSGAGYDYDLTSLEFGLGSAGSPAPVAQIFGDNSGAPGSALATFTLSGAAGAKGIYSFTGSFAVQKNTSYWVVLSNPNSASLESSRHCGPRRPPPPHGLI